MYSAAVQIHDKLMSQVEVTPDGHWIWLASAGTGGGHGRIHINGKFWVAHRLAWVLEHGDIPDDVQIWSTCRVDRCIRPAHHEALTDHTARSRMSAAYTLDRDTCKYGHEWTQENTRISPRGLKQCRTCGRIWQRWHRLGRLSGQSWQEWSGLVTH